MATLCHAPMQLNKKNLFLFQGKLPTGEQLETQTEVTTSTT
jgi:hypothetical protein